MGTLKKFLTPSTSVRERSTTGESIGHQHPCIDIPISFRIYCDKSRFTYSIFYIGHERFKAISTKYSFKRLADIYLHETSSVDSPAIGHATLRVSGDIDVALPSGIQAVREHFWKDMHTFAMPVGGRMERFQWRRSRGKEVKRLGGWGSKWKLVRLDGDEIVAVYAVDLWTPNLSGRFEFLGAGATKELGRDWTIATVVTALALGEKERQDVATSSTS